MKMKITNEYLREGLRLKQEMGYAKSSILAIEKMTFDELTMPIVSHYEAIMKVKINKSNHHHQLVVNKVASMMPIIDQMFPRDSNGQIIGWYLTYWEERASLLSEIFTKDFIQIRFGNEDLNATFCYNITTEEIYALAYIGQGVVYTQSDQKPYIIAQLDKIVKGRIYWNTKGDWNASVLKEKKIASILEEEGFFILNIQKHDRKRICKNALS